jgi:glycosyltransferase involved in cell wall biosynthesis
MNWAGPRVSVLLASRDGARHLPAALASIAEQTWREIELVAVDDGSSDATPELFARHAISHPGTRVIRTEGLGLAAALELAAGQATGELLARHDDDDVSHPERIARQVAFLAAHPGIVLVGTAARVIDDAGVPVGEYLVPLEPGQIRRRLARVTPFVHGSVMMRAEVYRAAGGYRREFRASQDYDLWLRLPADAGLANLPEPLYLWRHHPRGVFARAREQQLFYGALARAFAEERRETGADAYAALEAAAGPEAFVASYPRAGRFALRLGEAYTREGRVAEARRHLVPAFGDPRSRGEAFAWWALTFAVALTPRAARARAAAVARARAAEPHR